MKRLLLVIAISAVIAASSCSGGHGAKPDSGSDPQAAPSLDDKKLFEATCSKCHKVTRAEAYKGSVPWKSIIDRMINEHGAKVTPEDQAKIVAYLENTYPKKSAG